VVDRYANLVIENNGCELHSNFIETRFR